MTKPRRRIKKARITHISLCPRGMNKLPVVFKSDDESGNLDVQFETVLKANEEEGTITALVWPADVPDAMGDVATADVVKQMAHGFMREMASGNGGLDIRHNLETVDPSDAWIAESFLVQKDDPRFSGMTDRDGQAIDPTGAWATVIKLDSEELRAQYRSGDWDGVSMYGQALVEPVSKSEFDLEMAASRVFDAMADRLATRVRNGEIDVDETRLLEILAQRDTTLAETIGKSMGDAIGTALAPVTERLDKLEKSSAPDDDTTDDEPKGFEVPEPVLKSEDFGNPEALAKYHRDLHRFKLAKSVDFKDPDAVKAYMEEVAKLDAEEAKLKKQDDKPAPSTQGVDDDVEPDTLAKEQHSTAARLARAAGSYTGVGSYADKKD